MTNIVAKLKARLKAERDRKIANRRYRARVIAEGSDDVRVGNNLYRDQTTFPSIDRVKKWVIEVHEEIDSPKVEGIVLVEDTKFIPPKSYGYQFETKYIERHDEDGDYNDVVLSKWKALDAESLKEAQTL